MVSGQTAACFNSKEIGHIRQKMNLSQDVQT